MTDPPKKLGKGPLDIPALVFALVGILVFVMLWAVCGVLGSMVGGWVRAAPPRARHPTSAIAEIRQFGAMLPSVDVADRAATISRIQSSLDGKLTDDRSTQRAKRAAHPAGQFYVSPVRA
jgi:hypothetical protein